jgi:hypothetical protein
MIPTSSSISTNGCDNISSNCVIWQGPDIACINLCSGDSVSEVVSKLATEVCTLITSGVTANPNLTGLDLTCLNIPGTTPTQIVPVLQAMVVQICANTNSKVQPAAGLPIMTLPVCLQYNDAGGNPVTQLPLDQFATRIANQVCLNLSAINIIQSTLTSYNTRLNTLEACVLPCSGAVVEAQVIPTCILPATLTNVSVLLLALEARFCALETAVGLPAAILGTIGQTKLTSASAQLTNPGSNYGSIGGWNSTPVNLAQTVQNAWVVIDDMYTAIASIQLNCCPSGCDTVIFRYTTTNSLSSAGEIQGINFNFQTSSIPAAFNDCAGSTVITITDVDSVAVTSIVNVSTLQNDASGVLINIPTLNTNGDLSVSVAFCATNAVDTCSETQTSVITGVVPCPAGVTATSITQTGVTVGFANLLGTTATYVIDIIDTATTLVVATYTQNNPTATVSHAFTGLTPGTNFSARITVTMNGITQVCPNPTLFSSLTADAPCTNGMDVAFIIDYTASMGDEIDAIKTGAASLVNTIDTSSGSNNYRLSLVTADEKVGTTSNPSYATSTDYLALPAAQRIINTGTGHRQFITAWEMFQTDNGSSFTTQLNLLNTGSPTAGVPLGSGDGAPEPTDMALGQIIEASEFTGAFRDDVAKYVIIITDNVPGGSDDVFNDTDVARLNSLQTTALLKGIKIFVLGPGTSIQYTSGAGVVSYPWRDISIATGGNWNVSEDPTTITSEITSGCS